MTDVKWVKLNVAMFDDDKIKIIETMPEADSILIIWVKLLTLAGKKNMNGYIFLTENIPYTDKMLAGLLNRPLTIVRLALETFKRFNMIDYNDSNQLHITNWEKHQNIEGLDKIREQTRKRVAAHREKQKMLGYSNATSNATITQSNATEIEEELEQEKEEEDIYAAELFENIRTDIFNHWNSQNIQRHNELTDEISKTIDKTLKKYSLEDIKTAITRYGIIYHDETHFFNYKWTLTKFLSQSNALPSFLDDGDKWSNYAQKGEPTETMDDLLRRMAGEGCEIYLGPNKTYKVGVKT